MYRKPLFKLSAIVSASVAAYYHNEVYDGSVACLRFGRTFTAVASIVADYKKTVGDQANGWSEVHLRSAKKLLELCETNGGTFIKVGQHLGALDYLIPTEYVKTLKVLHSNAPQTEFDQILKVIKQDLKCEPSEVFESIEKKPLGAASLAQVHKAKLKDGTTVAVKVQHPLVKNYSDIDMKTMEILFRAAAWFFPEFKLMWLVNETKRNLPCELDFTMEGSNAEKTANLLSHLSWLHIPKIYWKWTTPRVLTMEYCEGVNIGELSEKSDLAIDRKDVARKLTTLFSEMIFLHGYLHCDPHPGNLRVQLRDNGDVTVHLLDHGLYLSRTKQQLPDRFRDTYSKFWMSILNSDVEDMKANAKQLGIGELYGLFACMTAGRSWDAILHGIDKTGKTKNEEAEIKSEASKYLAEMTDVLHNVPREMLLILKTNDLLRGLDHLLGVKENTLSFVTMSRCCAKANFNREYSNCHSIVSKIKVTIGHYLASLRITLYQVCLWWIAKS